jgi:hypothetical protein
VIVLGIFEENKTGIYTKNKFILCSCFGENFYIAHQSDPIQIAFEFILK